MISTQDRDFLIGAALGDGYLRLDKEWGSVTLAITHTERQAPYAAWKLDRLNAICGTSAKMYHFSAKNKYPSVAFGVTSKRILGPIRELLYPDGIKVFRDEVLKDLGPEALALYWMDDGSLEVRKRKRPRSVKIERSGWLPVSRDQSQVTAVSNWIESLTGARSSVVRHKSGLLYLRWFAMQFRLLVESIEEYIHPCLYYKVDLNRSGTVAEWLSESQHLLVVDNKTARAPRTQIA